MTLEKFTKPRVPDRPAITVRKNGTICVNRKAIEQFKLEGMRFATLHYDKKEGIMGIKPLDDDSDTSAVKISKEKNRTYVISCQTFLKHCGILYEQGSKVLKATWDDKAKIMLAKLT